MWSGNTVAADTILEWGTGRGPKAGESNVMLNFRLHDLKVVHCGGF